MNDTIRLDRTWTRLPAGVRQIDLAAQHPVAEVERALVGLQVGHRQQHRLVVDVELHRLVVGDVDDGLTDPREAERLLGVTDRPRLVEAVHEGAVEVGLATLLDVAAHPEIAVADGEQRLGDCRGRRSSTRPRPAPTRRSGSGDRSSGSACCRRLVAGAAPHAGTTSARSRTTTSAPAAAQPLGADASIDADHETEAAGLARLDPGDRVLDDDRPLDRASEARGGTARTCRGPACRAARAPRRRCRPPRRRSGRRGPPRRAPPARSARTRRRRPWCPLAASRSSSATEPG